MDCFVLLELSAVICYFRIASYRSCSNAFVHCNP